MSSHISYITEKCQIANPKLKELSFGCEVEYYWDSFRWQQISDYIFLYQSADIVVYLDKNVPTDSPEYRLKIFSKDDICEEDFEILGHPIQLSDILLAISKNLKQGDCLNAHINSYNQLSFRTLERPWLVDWNLLLPLTEQTPETIQWIAESLWYNS